MLRLFNSLSGEKEEIKNENKPFGVYTCGPTVYLSPHIGNWRTFIFYDTLIRVLKVNDFDARWVINITDVGHLVSDGDSGEDKVEKQAKASKVSAWDIAEGYTKEFLDGMAALNMTKPFKLPRATNHIKEQIEMVKTLEEKGYTYEIEGDGIYFDTSKWEDYATQFKSGKADEEYGRINENSNKRNFRDFALWKFSPKDVVRDMEWESPWGVGFPGWHIECSAMAKKYLGETLDVHAGGIDHIPIHHTNEIAQSEVANGVPFARVWLHSKFMLVDDARMGKSKGNFYTLKDVLDRTYTPLDFRMLVVQSGYRSESNFTWEALEAAKNARWNFLKLAARRWQHVEDGKDVESELQAAASEMVKVVSDDLNTPAALGVFNEALKLANEGLNKKSCAALTELVVLADKILGLNIAKYTEDLLPKTKELFETRMAAKKSGDFAKSDELRDRLREEFGIELEDGPNGVTFWERGY